MSNLITKTTELAMSITGNYVKPGDLVVDATCGGGHDTLALAKSVGASGEVYAFDIQQKALDLTGVLMEEENLTNAKLIHDSFVNMGEYVGGETAAAIVFNLGYLPGGDHGITTKAEETIAGLEVALECVKPEGIITVVMYDGHKEGAREKEQVLEWAKRLDTSKYHVAYVNMLNQWKNPPEILWITKS